MDLWGLWSKAEKAKSMARALEVIPQPRGGTAARSWRPVSGRSLQGLWRWGQSPRDKAAVQRGTRAPHAWPSARPAHSRSSRP